MGFSHLLLPVLFAVAFPTASSNSCGREVRAPGCGPGGPRSEGEDYVRFAREVVRAEVLRQPAPAVPEFGPAQPVFVTVERNGRILGCRGSLESRRSSLGAELLDAAKSACAHDPRYRPIRKGDLDGFLVTVTVVRRLEAIEGVEGLTPADGLVLMAGGKSGVVLPWEGKDPAVRLKWAYQKAGVPIGSSARLMRMVAERWRG